MHGTSRAIVGADDLYVRPVWCGCLETAAYAAVDYGRRSLNIRIMKTNRQFTAIIQREDDGFVALCPEVDVASQGDTVEEARANLQEAVELLLETASPSEIAERLHGETYVTRLEVAVG